MLKKRKGLSNKLIVPLLVVALIISSMTALVYDYVKLTNFKDTHLQFDGATGANITSVNGTTVIELLATAQITLYGNIDWGTGNVLVNYTPGHDFCELIAGTNQSGNLRNTNRNFSIASPYHNSTQSAPCDPFVDQFAFVLINTGNVNIPNVTVVSQNGVAGWQSTFNSTTENGTYQFHIVPINGVGGGSSDTCNAIHVNGAGNWQNFTTSPQQICTDFEFSGFKDAIAIETKITIPEDAAQNQWLDTLTYTAQLN